MPKPKHRTFNGERFVDKFGQHPLLLRDFARKFDSNLFPSEADFQLDDFKELAADAAKKNPTMLENLCRAFDLSSERGHDALCQVMRDAGLEIDDTLPVECLAIWLHNTDEDLFHFAYDRYAMNQVDKASIYRVEPPEKLPDAEEIYAAFEETLKKAFEEERGTSNVLVRKYEENNRLNIIVYHEKRIQAQLVFKNSTNAVAPVLLRPAKQDFLSFHRETGELHIDASFSNEKKLMRRAFAGTFLDDTEVFESEEASKVLNLDVIASPNFSLPTEAPEHSARVVELHFRLPRVEWSPTFTIRSRDVLGTLQHVGMAESDGLEAREIVDVVDFGAPPAAIQDAQVSFAKIRIEFGEKKRDQKTVELRARNTIAFNQSTYYEEVLNYLRNWGILLAPVPAQVLA